VCVDGGVYVVVWTRRGLLHLLHVLQPKLPFSVYGTVAMARSEDDPNDASSQFFFLLFDPELTTAGEFTRC
jgi:cyclophilin family peptidyl-prolyl cis-trans isomerase